MKIDDKYFFIHIPKCGGNSVFPGPVATRVKLFNHNLRNKNFTYFKDSEERKNAKFSFTFVRNPWDRLVSAYFFKKGRRHLGG